MLLVSDLMIQVIDGSDGIFRGHNHLAEVHESLLAVSFDLLDQLIADSACCFGLIDRTFCLHPALVNVPDHPELEVIGDFLRLLTDPLAVDYQEVLGLDNLLDDRPERRGLLECESHIGIPGCKNDLEYF